MHWLYFIVIAVAIRALYSLGTKASTTHVRVHHTTLSTVLLFGSAILSLLFSPFVGGLDFSGFADNWVSALIMVVSLGLGNIIYFRGQGMVDAGTTQIALATKLVWTAILAIPILGASYDLLQVGGMFVLAVAIFLVSSGIKSAAVSKGAVIIAISAVAFSFNSIFSADFANVVSPAAYLLVSYLGAGTISLIPSIKHLKKDVAYIKKNSQITMRYAGLTSFISFAYFLAIYYTFDAANSDNALPAVLTNAQVVTTVIAATFILGERENALRKSIAGVLVLIASVLIAGIFS